MLVSTGRELSCFPACKNKLQYFFKILQKYYQLLILGTLMMSGHFHQIR